MPDPRGLRGRRYPLAGLLAVAVTAVLAGARSFTAIGQWARACTPEQLTAFGLAADRAPDESTFRYLFAKLNALAVDAAISVWIHARARTDDPVANRMFSAVMSSTFMRRRIVGDNLLVERFLLPAVRHVTSEEDREHYRAVFPDPASRAALAVAPREIRAARSLLSALEQDAVQRLGEVPAIAVWGMKDPVFRPRHALPRLRSIFSDVEVVELHDVAHFVPEEAAAEVAAAIDGRF